MSEAFMESKIDKIKEKLKHSPVIIGISGPSGAGKDYLTQKAIEYFSGVGVPTYNVQMVTEREHRGAVETKVCVTPNEYTQLQKNGELIGDHVNKVRYGYKLEDIKRATDDAKSKGGIVIIELNPSKQSSFPAELKERLEIELTAWIGVKTTLDQTRANMKERGESEEIINQRLKTMQEFVESMGDNKNIYLVDNGPNNRSNSQSDFINIIKESILSS